MEAGPSCICDGVGSLCAACIVAYAVQMWRDHPDSLSPSMLKRRIRGLRGREAALLVEFTKRLRPVRRYDDQR